MNARMSEKSLRQALRLRSWQCRPMSWLSCRLGAVRSRRQPPAMRWGRAVAGVPGNFKFDARQMPPSGNRQAGAAPGRPWDMLAARAKAITSVRTTPSGIGPVNAGTMVMLLKI